MKFLDNNRDLFESIKIKRTRIETKCKLFQMNASISEFDYLF